MTKFQRAEHAQNNEKYVNNKYSKEIQKSIGNTTILDNKPKIIIIIIF